MFVDTNVLSELMRPKPDPAVLAWADTLSPKNVKLSVIVVAEINSGLSFLPSGKRKQDLVETALGLFGALGGNIVALSEKHVPYYAEISRVKKQTGRPLMPMDNLIAAMALEDGSSLATRNNTDFAGLGLTLINPWQFSP